MKTIKDIAKIAGVSQSTVSKALNNRHDIGFETKERILKIVKAYNFSPNVFGKSLKSKITGNVGVIFCREQNPLSANPFYSRVLEGIEAGLAINNYNLMLNIIQENSRKELPKVIRERQVDGLILIGSFRQALVEKIMLQKVHTVLVDPKVVYRNCCEVLIDNAHGAYLATQYLIDTGHKRIGFISGDLARLSFKQRFNGYKKALKVNGINFDHALVRTGGIEEGYHHTKNLLEQQKITAIFSANDINALHGYKAVYDLKLKIPDDISIIGFDDISLAEISFPPLTTIRVYKEELGSIAVRTLISLIKNEINKPVTTIVPIKLIERGSVKKLSDRLVASK
jgi:LacI family transcriptional regulator